MSLPATGEFADRVMGWQSVHGRRGLPWQGTRDPYCVWLSEVMLQQTQVTTVLAYFERFLKRFPDVQALAEADPDAVLACWSGLGYYSRARNLHRCAQLVVERHGGVFPSTAAALEGLPGIGRSTAAAIAAFCFGERVAILDANVKRVLARTLGFDGDLTVASQTRELWNLATKVLPPAGEAMGPYTQGLMDLGATVCLPRAPRCTVCPLANDCVGLRRGDPELLPKRGRKLTRSFAHWWLLVARDAGGRTWMQRRPSSGIWGGLHCVPVFQSRDELMNSADLDSGHIVPVYEDLNEVMHVLTHKDLHLHPVLATPYKPLDHQSGQWLGPDDLATIGLPAPVRQLLTEVGSLRAASPVRGAV